MVTNLILCWGKMGLGSVVGFLHHFRYIFLSYFVVCNLMLKFVIRNFITSEVDTASLNKLNADYFLKVCATSIKNPKLNRHQKEISLFDSYPAILQTISCNGKL
jgi:hypothetical protein